MKRLLLGMVLFSANLFATIQVGEVVPNLCWQDSDEKTYCLDDARDTVRVLLFNAGWCPPCNSEFAELVPRLGEFAGKPVTFISVSGQGWSKGSPPDTQFLEQWKNKFKIPFPVCGKKNEFGQQFNEPAIPNVAIVDRNGKLGYKAVAPGVSRIFLEVRSLLQ